MRAPRRVLMTADAVGGIWTFSLELAHGLARHGVETALAVLGPPPSEEQAQTAAAVPGLQLLQTDLDLEWCDRKGPLTPDAACRLRELARSTKADIVHVNGYREAAAGFDAPVLIGAHSCVRSWWMACKRGEPDAEWSAYEEGVRRGLAAADAVVAPSYAYLRAFKEAWGDLPHARLVFNGLDIGRAAFGKRHSVILSAGRFSDPAKNLDTLVEACRALPWPLQIAGDTSDLKANGRLCPLGPLSREQLLDRMASAAIFVAPSRYEPFGLAVLEAAKSGCALVLAEIPTLVELWDGAAAFFPPGDPQALQEVLADLIENEDRRRELQQQAMVRARSYSRTRMAREHLALYRRLLQSHDVEPLAREAAA